MAVGRTGVLPHTSRTKGREANNPVYTLTHQVSVAMSKLLHLFLKYSPWILVVIQVSVLVDHSGIVHKAAIRGLVAAGWTLMTALLAASACHLLIFNPIYVLLCTGRNGFPFLWSIVPAQVFALVTSSSLMTLPMTLAVMHNSHRSTRKRASHFILATGSTFNMPGAALSMPIVMIFLAEVSGYGKEMYTTPLQIVQLIVLSLLSSIGGAPVPNAGLVMMVSVWRSSISSGVGNLHLPQPFVIIFGIEFVADRIRTAINVTGDLIACYIVAYTTGEMDEVTASDDEAFRSQTPVDSLLNPTNN